MMNHPFATATATAQLTYAELPALRQLLTAPVGAKTQTADSAVILPTIGSSDSKASLPSVPELVAMPIGDGDPRPQWYCDTLASATTHSVTSVSRWSDEALAEHDATIKVADDMRHEAIRIRDEMVREVRAEHREAMRARRAAQAKQTRELHKRGELTADEQYSEELKALRATPIPAESADESYARQWLDNATRLANRLVSNYSRRRLGANVSRRSGRFAHIADDAVQCAWIHCQANPHHNADTVVRMCVRTQIKSASRAGTAGLPDNYDCEHVRASETETWSIVCSTQQQARVVEMLRAGRKTREVAEAFDVTPRRIRQIVRSLTFERTTGEVVRF